MRLNRRDFIKSLSATAATPLFISPAFINRELSDDSPHKSSNNPVTILFDSSRCIGCHECEKACREWNHIPQENQSWTQVKPITGLTKNNDEQLFGKYQCMHCNDAACIQVCPTGALSRRPSGFVAYDIGKCSGCGYCMQFCPFKVPFMEGNVITGLQTMHKCTFCQDRIAIGLQAACVEACPTNALMQGNRDDIINIGKARIAYINKEYPDAILYGENELEGLQVIYILMKSPPLYSLPESPEIPAATLVWKDLIQPLGFISAGLLILGLGLNYLIARSQLGDKEPTDNNPERK
jgi:formate dehydrogenase iron-sulfur subunit